MDLALIIYYVSCAINSNQINSPSFSSYYSFSVRMFSDINFEISSKVKDIKCNLASAILHELNSC